MSFSNNKSTQDNEFLPTYSESIDYAIDAFQMGNPVLVHDFNDREGETDLIYPALSVTPRSISRLRNDAGGLICVALDHDVAETFDLPFIADELAHPSAEYEDVGYDERSSFSLSVNHRETHTGITDDDRAYTISRVGSAALSPESTDFAAEFRTPGHVHLLKGAPGLLDDRQGHTELGLALVRAAGRAPAVVVCEMLDDATGAALEKEEARRYSREYGFPYIEGDQILDAFP